MGLTLLTPATVFPVTLEEAKAQCRVMDTSEDTYIESLIAAATTHVERITDKSIAEQQWLLTLDGFDNEIELLRGPVISVDSVEYLDSAGVTQTADSALYSVNLSAPYQQVVLAADQSWPDTFDAFDAVAITYTVGMGAVPADMIHAIKIGIQRLYERNADPRDEEAMARALEALSWPNKAMHA